jgi:hypothetical protein
LLSGFIRRIDRKLEANRENLFSGVRLLEHLEIAVATASNARGRW